MRVLIVDDHNLFRDGVASLLGVRGYQVVGQASDGEEALVKARELRPDLVLMDIRMPRMGGVAATRLLKAEMPDITVVMLTASDDEADLFEAIKSGAQGYLLKDLKADAFFALLAGVERGEAAISPRMAAHMLDEFSRLAKGKRPEESSNALSEREAEVLSLVAQGRTNKEVAAALYISDNTVKYHLRNILDTLHLENRAQVVAYAARRGLAGPEVRP
ncbi:MAG: response regulator transcription factor [Armatimonadetes bacterium]|nr:response regulator transcription factor [Armatimonadota bacterium]MBI2918707.1 response regulator transcription factor [Chloroflexota bacterium]